MGRRRRKRRRVMISLKHIGGVADRDGQHDITWKTWCVCFWVQCVLQLTLFSLCNNCPVNTPVVQWFPNCGARPSSGAARYYWWGAGGSAETSHITKVRVNIYVTVTALTGYACAIATSQMVRRPWQGKGMQALVKSVSPNVQWTHRHTQRSARCAVNYTRVWPMLSAWSVS